MHCSALSKDEAASGGGEAPPSRCVLPHLLLALLLCAAACRPACAQQQAAEQQADVAAAQCAFSVRYEVSLGQGQTTTPSVPIFVASLGLQNNQNVSAGDNYALYNLSREH
ncbi:hypothetical protein D9Q98_009210 [Chlorella vulgaris]|uniref:Uncharacterized protein n=1 Tax=Chlorella vulgaris TaxID=3077 RepID=A0A9D4YX58_CHLVU|nr:hypothetical protein D9Q98_009210 [Chlorella vulgaris]